MTRWGFAVGRAALSRDPMRSLGYSAAWHVLRSYSRSPSRQRRVGTVRTTPGRRPPPWLRRAVLNRDGWHCLNCGSPYDLHMDHIVPWIDGGPTTFDNLQTLCATCNYAKGAAAVDLRGRPVGYLAATHGQPPPPQVHYGL